MAGGNVAVAVIVLLLANFLCYLANSTTWLHKKLRLPYMLSISNRSSAAAASKQRTAKFWAFDLLDPRDPVDSYFIGPYGLAILRVAIMLYFAAGIVLAGTTGPGYGGAHWMVYFTDWSFVLIFVSAALGFANSVMYLAARRKRSTPAAALPAQPAAGPPGGPQPVLPSTNGLAWDGSFASRLDPGRAGAKGVENGTQPGPESTDAEAGTLNGTNLPGEPAHRPVPDSDGGRVKTAGEGQTGGGDQWTLLGKLHALALELAAVTALLVTLFFWTFLADRNRGNVHPDDYVMHAANSCIMFADVVASRVALVSYHFQLMLLYGSAFEVFMWIYWRASGKWVYGVFDWDMNTALALYIALPIVYAILFYVWCAA